MTFWCKVASNLDSDPKIRRAGRNGREVFLFALRRNAEPGHKQQGLLAAEMLEPAYVADLLMMTEADAKDGLDRCLGAGLLRQLNDGYEIAGWDDEQWGRPSSGAERTARWRISKAVTNGDGRDVTQRHAVTVGDACDTSDKTRQDKTRLEETIVPPSAAKPKSRACQFPAGWEPNSLHAEKAKLAGLILAREVEAFRDHHTAKGNRFADWDAAFRTWIRNAQKFRGQAQGGLEAVLAIANGESP